MSKRRGTLLATFGTVLVVISMLMATGVVLGDSHVVTVSMDELNSSGQTGTAMLTAQGSSTEVVVSLSAGALQSELMHIHSGSCGNLGGVVHPLTSFSGGSGESSTTVSATLDDLLGGNFTINAHKAGEAGLYTACGNLPARVGSSGGSRSFAGGLVTLDIPQGALSADVDIWYQDLTAGSAPAAPPAGTGFGAVILSLATTPATTFTRAVNVTVAYSADDIAAGGANYTNVKLYAYDAGFKEWQAIDAAIRDIPGLTLTTQQTRLGIYAIIVTGAAAPTPEPTPAPAETPDTGDLAPGTGLLLGLAAAGLLLVLGGGYLFLRRSSGSRA